MEKFGRSFAAACRLSLLVLSSLLIGCRSGNGNGASTPSRDIKSVMEAHVDDLMAIPGVVGVAIGELKDGTPCIQVLVVERTSELRRKIPKTLEGHPIDIVVSGIIKPL
ncbi:MAG: hypothetical protein WC674_00595 [Candidatus Krumholzibacteriia bacterium]